MAAIWTGYGAIALLLLVLLPPLRLGWIASLRERLAPSMRWHHVLGYWLLALVFMHVVVVVWPYLGLVEGWSEIMSLFFAGDDPVMLTGTLASLGLLTTFALAMARHWRRRVWLFWHRLSLLAWFFVLAHLGWRWQQSWPWEWSWLWCARGLAALLTALASVGLIAHFIWPEGLTQHRNFVVACVHTVSDTVTRLRLALDAGAAIWLPGHFGYFRFACHGPCGVSLEAHPFSVVGRDAHGHIEIVVQASGDDTACLQKMQQGTGGIALGPYGELPRLLHTNPRQVWVAGGLGILPFLGLLHYWLDRRRRAPVGAFPRGDPQITLFYLYRQGHEPLFLDEVSAIGAALGANLRVITLALTSDSVPAQEILAALPPRIEDLSFVVAGPKAMLGAWLKFLNNQGVRRQAIHTEDVCY